MNAKFQRMPKGFNTKPAFHFMIYQLQGRLVRNMAGMPRPMTASALRLPTPPA